MTLLNSELIEQSLNTLQAGAIILDKELKVQFWNQWLVDHSDIDEKAILGEPLFEYLQIEADSFLSKRVNETLQNGLSCILSNTIHRSPLPLYSLEGNRDPVEQKILLSRLNQNGEHFCLIHIYDVSEVRRRERSLKRQTERLYSAVNELAEAEEQIRSIFDLTPDSILVLDEAGNILNTNAAANKMFGFVEPPQIYNFLQLISELNENESFAEQFFSNEQEKVADNFRLTGLSLTGDSFPVKISVIKTDQTLIPTYSVICRDISERMQTEKRLKQLAHFDTLTGLHNRATFNDELDKRLKTVKRSNLSIALLYLDLDNLKPTNDRFGHRGGDILLRTFANRLKSTLREDDYVSRIGGDEFTIIISESQDKTFPNIEKIAERLLEKIKEPIKFAQDQLYPSASIGIAINSSYNREELVKHADTAMYQAKKQGKGRFIVFDESMGDEH